MLVLDTGTVVTFFYTDLFFGVALLTARGQLSSSGERRVLTFPSGFFRFGGKFDLKLFVSLGGGYGLDFFVCAREDAEGHGDAGFKVQVGDLTTQESSSRQPFV
jgi:hypothetical protein